MFNTFKADKIIQKRGNNLRSPPAPPESASEQSVSLSEFPDILRPDINFTRPNKCAITDKNLTEEILVVQLFPIRFAQIPSAVKDATLTRIELDIDLVAVQWLRLYNIVYGFHCLNAEDQS